MIIKKKKSKRKASEENRIRKNERIKKEITNAILGPSALAVINLSEHCSPVNIHITKTNSSKKDSKLCDNLLKKCSIRFRWDQTRLAIARAKKIADDGKTRRKKRKGKNMS